jgi:hypothetical protein
MRGIPLGGGGDGVGDKREEGVEAA